MNEGHFLKEKDREILKEMHLASSGKKDADKIKAILFLDKGWTYNQICEALLLDERTIHRYRKLYEEEGLDGLLENRHKGRLCKLTAEEQKDLTEELRNKLYSNTKQICGFIKKKYRKVYTPKGLVPLLRKLGFSYKKTKSVPAKANEDAQKKFIKGYEKRRKNLKKGEKIYFTDAVHPTYNMMPDYAWVPTGEERYIKSTSGRQRLNILGAYSPNDHDRIILPCETVNRYSTIDLLKKIEDRNPFSPRIYVYMDNARCNHSRDLRKYIRGSRIKPLYFPSYSPNLNLIERLWWLMKRKAIGNIYYETFEEFKIACVRMLRRRNKTFLGMLDTLMTEKFHCYPTVTN